MNTIFSSSLEPFKIRGQIELMEEGVRAGFFVLLNSACVPPPSLRRAVMVVWWGPVLFSLMLALRGAIVCGCCW